MPRNEGSSSRCLIDSKAQKILRYVQNDNSCIVWVLKQAQLPCIIYINIIGIGDLKIYLFMRVFFL